MRKKSVFAQPKNRVPARNADGAGEKYEIEHDESHFTVINEVFPGDFPHQCFLKAPFIDNRKTREPAEYDAAGGSQRQKIFV